MERLLDVRDLEPPEPLVETLNAASALLPGDHLLMLHRRFPCLLEENLRRLGFSCLIREGARAPFETFIWRNGDGEGEAAARVAASLR